MGAYLKSLRVIIPEMVNPVQKTGSSHETSPPAILGGPTWFLPAQAKASQILLKAAREIAYQDPALALGAGSS